MLEHYYKHPTIMARLRTGLLGDYVDELAAWLAERDYKRDTAVTYIRYASYLGRWLDDTGRTLENLDEALVAEFVAAIPDLPYTRRTNQGKNSEIKTSMRLVLRRLREDGLVRTTPPVRPVPALIGDFEAWMVTHRAVQQRTMRKSYRPVLRRLLASLGEELETYNASGIRAFILAWAEEVGRNRVVTRLNVIRMFLRYLATVGRCPPELVGAVPRLAPWRLTTLPRWIRPEEVEQILDSCDLSRPVGVRDRSILLLLARLGLRAVDVARLRLDDIDWAEARIWVCGKTPRKEALPLPQDVGDALLAYLVDGRPAASGDHVFVGARAPHAPLGPESVTAVVIRAARRAEVSTPEVGSHVLRHSLATALLAEGMSLAGIGAVLRHSSLDTTRVYAKVDIATLKSVARPWPLEVSS